MNSMNRRKPKDDGWREFKAYMTSDSLWMLSHIAEEIKQAKTTDEKENRLEMLSIIIGTMCLDHDLNATESNKQGLDGCYPNIKFEYRG